MTVVTLTSDLGTGDYHVAAVKGTLLQTAAPIQLVDISHDIKPYNYIHAARVVDGCFRDFPKGSLHLVGVEGDFGRKNEWLLAHVENHMFIVKNTGFLSLISPEPPGWCYLLPVNGSQSLKFPLKSIVAQAALGLLDGKKPASLGSPFQQLVESRNLSASIMQQSIRGQVVHITPYNNVVTNIHRRDLENFGHFRTCKIHYNRLDYFDRIYNSYHDVPEGAAACFFGSDGFLEIGIHGGNAHSLLNMHEGKYITLEFDNPKHDTATG
ncbi:MAG: SAM-dependent chlorinase/fluorinase [Bacteroidetes bacterium]|jgi:S-adenosylmethionine hydrolase|nr:SAM-dependent chlorinase/fluorinase [Bacteroidota bacterium]